jgi:hypothetical protein
VIKRRHGRRLGAGPGRRQRRLEVLRPRVKFDRHAVGCLPIGEQAGRRGRGPGVERPLDGQTPPGQEARAATEVVNRKGKGGQTRPLRLIRNKVKAHIGEPKRRAAFALACAAAEHDRIGSGRVGEAGGGNGHTIEGMDHGVLPRRVQVDAAPPARCWLQKFDDRRRRLAGVG